MELNCDAVRDVLLVLEDSFEYVSDESFEHGGYFTQGELLPKTMDKVDERPRTLSRGDKSDVNYDFVDDCEIRAEISTIRLNMIQQLNNRIIGVICFMLVNIIIHRVVFKVITLLINLSYK